MRESAGAPNPPASSENGTVDRNYRIEVFRKAIHLCSLSIPVIYWFVSKQTALTILLPLTFAFVLVDIARYYHRGTADLFYKSFGWLLRSHEQDVHRKRLNGASYVLIAAVLSVFIFPKIIAITSFSILILADSSAALIGRRFGRRRFFAKSLEGSLAFLAAGIMVVLLAPKAVYAFEEYILGVFAAVVGAVVEALSINIDDNLTIPLCVGGTLWLLYTLFLPSLDLWSVGLVP